MTSDERLAFEHDLEWWVDLDFKFNEEYFGSDSFFFVWRGIGSDLYNWHFLCLSPSSCLIVVCLLFYFSLLINAFWYLMLWSSYHVLFYWKLAGIYSNGTVVNIKYWHGSVKMLDHEFGHTSLVDWFSKVLFFICFFVLVICLCSYASWCFSY